MTENWDAISDDAKEWDGEPIVDARRPKRPETVVSVRMPVALADQARRLARSKDLTLSSYVRELIEQVVTRHSAQSVYSLDASKPSQVAPASSTTGGPENLRIPA